MIQKIDTVNSIHIDQLIILFNKYRIFYNKEKDLDKAREFLLERIKNNDSIIYIVLNEENVPVAFMQLYPMFSSTRMSKSWLLNDLFVDENYRGKGYSRKLIEIAKEVCIKTNACSILLETAKNNDIANQLYKQTGFVLEDNCNFYTWNIN
jgi:GNAT superfamily N-acetyltransferase